MPAAARFALLLTALTATAVAAQQPVPRATVPADTSGARPDTTMDTTTSRRPTRRAVAARPIIRPPISARRAMIYSMLVPGLGQSRLDRPATGAFFVAIEAAALTMAAKSAFDLAEAKAFRGDSVVVTSFPVDTAGVPIGTGTGAQRNNFTASLVRARRLHLEDWLALVAFNHLISGAEAFVSANLWGVPGEVAVRPTRRGTALSMTIAW